MTQCSRNAAPPPPQLRLQLAGLKEIRMNFEGGDITSDAGLLLIRAFDEEQKFTERISRLIFDPRQSGKIVHEQVSMIRQRIYQIAAGYQDCNDADRLRYDPTLKVVCATESGEAELASQPTLSRLENRVGKWELVKLSAYLLEVGLPRKQRRRRVILDIDSTDDPCHGQQQLALFNGFYDQYMYHPLLIFDGERQDLLSVTLRDGKSDSARGVIEALQPIVYRLKGSRKRRGPKIIIRADAGFALPELYEFCEKHELTYCLGMPANSVLKAKAQSLLEQVVAAFERTKESQREYSGFWYRAKSWSKSRRIIVKAECNREGTNLRFVVTNRKGSAKEVYEFYADRGESENWIKELKRGFCGDRLSCHAFSANGFRLLLHALAYTLVHQWKHHSLKRTELKNAQIDTLRIKVIKVGARVVRSARRIWFHLASGYPFAYLWRRVAQTLPCLEAT